MNEIFNINLITEPDFQRLNNFLMKGVEALSEKDLTPAKTIPKLTKELRFDFNINKTPLNASLILDKNALLLKWLNKTKYLASIDLVPSKEKINDIKERFNDELSNASPELLRLQNLEIKKVLKKQKNRQELKLNKLNSSLILEKESCRNI
ncbi:MAG: hypothetical protein RBR08_00420 [Desulforegulaceae bacterium]|nr:hypothetical protein [Desulforegulaceae bacterium]